MIKLRSLILAVLLYHSICTIPQIGSSVGGDASNANNSTTSTISTTNINISTNSNPSANQTAQADVANNVFLPNFTVQASPHSTTTSTSTSFTSNLSLGPANNAKRSEDKSSDSTISELAIIPTTSTVLHPSTDSSTNSHAIHSYHNITKVLVKRSSPIQTESEIPEDSKEEIEDEHKPGPQVECKRGNLCEIPLTSILGTSNPPIASKVTTLTNSSGLDLLQSQDGKSLIGIPISHGIIYYVLQYLERGRRTVEVPFKVNIARKGLSTHTFFLENVSPELDCKKSPTLCLQFLETLAKALDTPLSSITFERFIKSRNETTIVAFHDNTISLNKCEKEEIEFIKKKISKSGGEIKQDFLNKLKPIFSFAKFSFRASRACDDYDRIAYTPKSDEKNWMPLFLLAVVIFLVCSIVWVILKVRNHCKPDGQNEENGTNHQNNIELTPLREEQCQNEEVVIGLEVDDNAVMEE